MKLVLSLMKCIKTGKVWLNKQYPQTITTVKELGTGNGQQVT